MSYQHWRNTTCDPTFFIHHQHETMEDGHVLPTWPGRKSAIQVSSSASPSQSLSAPSPIDPGDLTHIWRCVYITTYIYTNYDRYSTNVVCLMYILSLFNLMNWPRLINVCFHIRFGKMHVTYDMLFKQIWNMKTNKTHISSILDLNS